MTTQKIILEQLGGMKFIAMTGAACFSDGPNTLITKFKGCKIANFMKITLNSMDTYDVVIGKYRKMELKVVKEVNGAYCDMLKDIFEQTTKLNTSL